MTPRTRFLNTLSSQPRDRVSLVDLGFWAECFDVWKEQGLPPEVDATNADPFFGTDGFWRGYLSNEGTDGSGLAQRGMVVPEGLHVGLYPHFDSRALSDEGEQEIVQLADGTRVRRHKKMSSIPLHEGYLLKDRPSWEKHYRTRLDPSLPSRFPSDWQPWDALAGDESRSQMLILPAGSLYGWIRNWMGVEEISYLIYDDHALFEEMVETIAHCVHETLDAALSRGGSFDAALFWEDMSYNGGPLISPQHFKRFLSPRYERIARLLQQHGIEHIIVDSDGRIDDLIPLWLDAGINTVLPFEIGTTGADPIDYRQRFGPDLRIIGGFDKRILSSSTEAIDREIDRLAPLVAEGGFIPTCDHKIPPDVSLANYQHYLATARKRWNG